MPVNRKLETTSPSCPASFNARGSFMFKYSHYMIIISHVIDSGHQYMPIDGNINHVVLLLYRIFGMNVDGNINHVVLLLYRFFSWYEWLSLPTPTYYIPNYGGFENCHPLQSTSPQLHISEDTTVIQDIWLGIYPHLHISSTSSSSATRLRLFWR